MPFDLDGPKHRLETARDRSNRRLTAAWLFAVCAMLWGMIVLGGATRLTGSGLSIMEWAPLSGALPPLSDAEWNRLFTLYQRIPQYALVNQGFGLDGFKHIFWLEWSHRLWGRLIGVVFLLPLLLLGLRGAIRRGLWLRLAGLFMLGGLQGAVGWFMVASGFARGQHGGVRLPARRAPHPGLAALFRHPMDSAGRPTAGWPACGAQSGAHLASVLLRAIAAADRSLREDSWPAFTRA